jgi:outer membrane immunogenic protein
MRGVRLVLEGKGRDMKKILLCGIALTIATMSSASAADMPLKAPPLPAWSWAGFYAGGNIGYGWASDPTTLTDTTATTLTRVDDADTPAPIFIPLGTTTATAAGTGNIDPKGWLGGIQGGYNWQSNSFVYGLEGDIQISGQKGTVTICDTAGCPVGSGSANDSLKMPWFGTLRGRFGFTPSPRWLVYGTAGLAVAEIQDSVTEGPVGGGAGTAWSTDTTRAGYAVGGGVEAALTDRWSIKFEYLYMGFGSISGGGTGAAVTTTTGACGFCAAPRIVEQITTQTSSATSTRIDDNVVRVGLNYHFGP